MPLSTGWSRFDDLIYALASMFEEQKDKGQGEFLEGEFGKERRVVKKGGRTRAWDASKFPVSFRSLSSSSSYPTPLCATATPPNPAHSPPSSAQPATDTCFLYEGG